MSRRQIPTRLILDETPIILSPSLAKQYSIVEAALLQQIHYMSQQPKLGLMHQGYKWVYNTLRDWQAHFACFSQSTIERAITRLKAAGLILIEKLNAYKTVRTNYYRIDYSKLPTHLFADQPDPQPATDTISPTTSSSQLDELQPISVTTSISSPCSDVLSKTPQEDQPRLKRKQHQPKKPSIRPLVPTHTPPIIAACATPTPTHPEPSAEQLSQLPELQRQLWQQLRRIKVDIAHHDPKIAFWQRRNLVHRTIQTLIDRKAQQVQPLHWHTLAALGL